MIETKRDFQSRLDWKWTLTRMLYERGYSKETIIKLYLFMDWLIFLPQDLQRQFRDRVTTFEEEQRMPYISSIERMGIEKGRTEGHAEGRYQHALQIALKFAEHKFGQLDEIVRFSIIALTSEQLDTLLVALFDMDHLTQLQKWLEGK